MEALTIFLGLLAGGMSYLVVNFWMQPLLRYLEIKHHVTSDFVFYANVIYPGGNEEMQQRRADRQKSNRRHAAELLAAYYRLPAWYRWNLHRVQEDPVKASTALIGLSNANEVVDAEPFITMLKRALRIPDTVIS